jgi:biotin operon repressor
MEKSDLPKVRLTVNKDQLAAEARSVAYLVANGHLSQIATLAETLQMGPAKVLVYVTIAVAAVQKLMRGQRLPEDLRDASPLGLEHTGYISRRAISSSTGLSRQTVRRLVDELLKDGLLISGPRGAVAAQPGLLGQQGIQACIQLMLAEVTKIAEQLIDLGVLEIRPKPPFPQP